MNNQTLSDEAILKELGRKITVLRLNQNKTQMQLAKESGLSRQTVQRAEMGEAIQTLSLVRLLRALQHLDGVDALLPEAIVSPIQQLKSKTLNRKRASRKKPSNTPSEPWVWGDEK